MLGFLVVFLEKCYTTRRFHFLTKKAYGRLGATGQDSLLGLQILAELSCDRRPFDLFCNGSRQVIPFDKFAFALSEPIAKGYDAENFRTLALVHPTHRDRVHSANVVRQGDIKFFDVFCHLY